MSAPKGRLQPLALLPLLTSHPSPAWQRSGAATFGLAHEWAGPHSVRPVIAKAVEPPRYQPPLGLNCDRFRHAPVILLLTGTPCQRRHTGSMAPSMGLQPVVPAPSQGAQDAIPLPLHYGCRVVDVKVIKPTHPATL